MILEHFGEDATVATCEGVCCDVCDTQPEMADAQNEMSLVLKTVRDLPGYGEVKVLTYQIEIQAQIDKLSCPLF